MAEGQMKAKKAFFFLGSAKELFFDTERVFAIKLGICGQLRPEVAIASWVRGEERDFLAPYPEMPQAGEEITVKIYTDQAKTGLDKLADNLLPIQSFTTLPLISNSSNAI